MRVITIIIHEQGKDTDLKIIETGNGSQETESERGLSKKLMQIIHAPLATLEGLKLDSQDAANPHWRDGHAVVHLTDGSSLSWKVTVEQQRMVTDYLSEKLGLPESHAI